MPLSSAIESRRSPVAREPRVRTVVVPYDDERDRRRQCSGLRNDQPDTAASSLYLSKQLARLPYQILNLLPFGECLTGENPVL